MIRKLLIALALLIALPVVADAACPGACFWIGGTGNMDLATDTLHWSATSGGTTCNPCEPNSSSTITFDGSSGGGTVTSTADISVGSFVADNFTGTLEFGTNNNNVTIAAGGVFTMSSAATHTLHMGSGTWTINGQSGTTVVTLFSVATDSGLTLTSSNVNLVFPAQTGTGQRTIQLGTSHTYGTITFGTQTSKNGGVSLNYTTGVTITNFNIGGGNFIAIANPMTATNLAFSGTATLPSVITGAAGGTTGPVTITTTTPSGGGVMFRGITLSGGSATITNCFDMFSNSFGSNTCSPPASGGGGGFIIGG